MLKDKAVRGVVLARIKQLERWLMGDVQRWAKSVSEPRILWVRDGGCTSPSWAHRSSAGRRFQA